MSSAPANPVTCLLLPHTRVRDLGQVGLEEEILGLFDLMHHRLVGYALSFGIPRQDGEDVVQDAFLALFRHLQQDRPRDNLRGWLFQVTHNLALRRRMRNTTQPTLPSEELESADRAHTPEEAILFAERHACLQGALNALPQTDQQCLRLRAEGLRYREISKILGISLGSVSASLARSLARLERAERRS
jgi:RNA polymerase sigma-70 factor (ECF subfamily)